MSNFQELRPSYSLQYLPSYAQPTQLHHPQIKMAPPFHQLPPSPHQTKSSTYQVYQEPDRFGSYFKNHIESFSNGSPESSRPQPALTFNTSSPHKARLKKSFRPNSKGGDSSTRKHETNSRSKLDDFSKTTSTFFIKTPQNMSDKPIFQFQKKQVVNLQNKMGNFSFQTKQNGWGGNQEALLKEIDNLRQTVDSFQRQILRLNQELDDLGSLKQVVEKQRVDIVNLNQHNNYLQTQCKHYLDSWEEKKKEQTISSNIIQGLEERNSCLLQQLSQNTFKEDKSQEQERKLNQLTQANSSLTKEKEKILTNIQKLTEELNIMKIQNSQQLTGKEEELGRVKRLLEIQTSKLIEHEHDTHINLSEISLLQIKITHLQQSNQKLQLQSTQQLQELKQFRDNSYCKQQQLSQKISQLNSEIGELEASLRSSCNEKCRLQLQSQSELSSVRAELAVSTAAQTQLRLQNEEILQILHSKEDQLRINDEKYSLSIKQLKETVQRESKQVEKIRKNNRMLEEELYKYHLLSLQAHQTEILAENENKTLRAEIDRFKVLVLQLEDDLAETKRQLSGQQQQFQIVKSQLQRQIFQQTSEIQQKYQVKIVELETMVETLKNQHQSEIAKKQTLIDYLQSLQEEASKDKEELSSTITALQSKLQEEYQNSTKALSSISVIPQEKSSPYDEEDGFIWVDREGLQYLQDILGCKCKDQGILNSIISAIQSLLSDFNELKQPALLYRDLLVMFDLEEDEFNNQLVKEITQLRENASILLDRTKELEQQLGTTEEEIMRLRKSRKQVGEIQKGEREQLNRIQQLNSWLNEETMRLLAQVSSSRLSTRRALHLIEGDLQDD